MARDDLPRARLSVLDRLLDAGEQPGGGRSLRRTATPEELKQIVRRDLEWLLSTRRAPEQDEPGGLGHTVVQYGIPDFSPVSPSDQQALTRIAYEVRTAIEDFEPRLRDVTVRVEPALEPGRVTVTVDALLVAGEVREPVAFPFKVQTSG